MNLFNSFDLQSMLKNVHNEDKGRNDVQKYEAGI